MSEKYIIKVLTLGESTVGKTSIVLRYSDDKFWIIMHYLLLELILK